MSWASTALSTGIAPVTALDMVVVMSDIRQALCADIYMSDEYIMLLSVVKFMGKVGLVEDVYSLDPVAGGVLESYDTLMLRFCMRFERKTVMGGDLEFLGRK